MAGIQVGFIPIEGGHYYQDALEEVVRDERAQRVGEGLRRGRLRVGRHDLVERAEAALAARGKHGQPARHARARHAREFGHRWTDAQQAQWQAVTDLLVVDGDVLADISVLEDRTRFIAVMQGSRILATAKQDAGVFEQNLQHFKRYVKSLFEK